MQSGDYLRSMHDSGAFGPEPVYASALRVNRVTVTVFLSTILAVRLY